MVSQFGSLGYTIMGKTADLTVVQKTIIDTLHKEDKPQTFITKEAGCSQSAVSKHVNSWVEGKSVEEKDAQPTERTERIPWHRRVNEFGYSCPQRRLTWAKEKKNRTVAQRSKVLFSDESKFCISFGNQGLESGGRVEKLIAQVAWSPVLSSHTAKSSKSWLNDGVGVFDWPANSPDLKPRENLCCIVKRKMRN